MSCYKSGGCGVYEMNSCSECPASRPEYLERQKKTDMSESKNVYTTSEDAKILGLFEVIKANTYKCGICGEIIFPKIITAGDGKFDVIVNSTSIHGGIGNEIVHDKVCPNCVNNISVVG